MKHYLVFMMQGKSYNYDAYGLLCAMHSNSPTQYSYIVECTPNFDVHLEADPNAFHPLISKLIWA